MKRLAILISLIVIACDRAIKILSNRALLHGSLGIIHFAHLHNYGATMGILRGDRIVLVTVGAIVFIGMVVVWLRSKTSSVWFWIGWALLMGGTVGNLWDRAVYGYVTDMLRMPGYPAIFNLADIGIRLGILMVLIGYWKRPRNHSS